MTAIAMAGSELRCRSQISGTAQRFPDPDAAFVKEVPR
jgi:hypothetical protein